MRLGKLVPGAKKYLMPASLVIEHFQLSKLLVCCLVPVWPSMMTSSRCGEGSARLPAIFEVSGLNLNVWKTGWKVSCA